jgi:hypothetical protein
MRLILAALLVLSLAGTANAQISIGIGLPSISIGVNIPFPALEVVPGFPVYYAPRASVNLFFYDGFYWVFHDNNWYTSAWYNGPWALVGMYDVPEFILRVPVRFYLFPPVYFSPWPRDSYPRWGDHYGRDWESRRSGWDRWDRNARYTPAPLPTYQRQYTGDRYPRDVGQQQQIHGENYKYRPTTPALRQHGQVLQRKAPQRQEGQATQPQRQVAPAPERQRSAPALSPQGGEQRAQQPQQAHTPQPKGEQRAQQPQAQREAPRAAPQRPEPQAAPRQQPPVERPASRVPPPQATQAQVPASQHQQQPRETQGNQGDRGAQGDHGTRGANKQ